MTEQEHHEGQLLDRGLARRGVRQLSVMADQLEARRDAPVIQELAAAGSPTRYSSCVPMRVLVFDRRIAFFALAAHDTRRGAYMTTASTLVQLACRLFDDVWQRAVAMPGLPLPDRSDCGTDEQQRRVLDLLAQGYTDEQIASDLRVSTRTIGRAVAQLQSAFSARGRFQLALFAQQAGLIALPQPNGRVTDRTIGGVTQRQGDATEPSSRMARERTDTVLPPQRA